MRGLGEGVEGGARLEARLPHRGRRRVVHGGVAVLAGRLVVSGAAPAALGGRGRTPTVGPPLVGGPWRVGWGASGGAG